MGSRRLSMIIAIFLAAALFCLAAYNAGLASAVGGQPGSGSDPLVTRSWVEAFVQQKLGSAPAGGGLVWEVKELEPDEVFLGRAGTEFVLRGGRAVIVDPTGSGIPDLTAGTNVAAGKGVAANHLFVVPKSDGRGIQAQTRVIIMFRGGSL
ncbi:MAG: hypothetical protein AB1815_10655 [Bacillota bacterium]